MCERSSGCGRSRPGMPNLSACGRSDGDDMTRGATRFSTEPTDAQWACSSPCCCPRPPPAGHEPAPAARSSNAMLYHSRTGYQWRHLPRDLPRRSTVYAWFVRRRNDGTWDRAMGALSAKPRGQSGRDDPPVAAALDSQSVPTPGPPTRSATTPERRSEAETPCAS